jgi:hypothetical protein
MIDALLHDLSLTEPQIPLAATYYATHREEIDARIKKHLYQGPVRRLKVPLGLRVALTVRSNPVSPPWWGADAPGIQATDLPKNAKPPASEAGFAAARPRGFEPLTFGSVDQAGGSWECVGGGCRAVFAETSSLGIVGVLWGLLPICCPSGL